MQIYIFIGASRIKEYSAFFISDHYFIEEITHPVYGNNGTWIIFIKILWVGLLN
ncbi:MULTISPECIES: hypothetical protein [unclassified Pedobacter]|uniref:hypothetical protein n=1 Tax=unclassified Pedobacter TaxID=2628915 RepID=UPI001423AE1B|nr:MULTISPECIES: hypothetical protein [unclassified Pedobacter]NII81179.1 hypothetical protein [Pedobacter sp. SG908]NMN35196.1 hypothetical protein [Pedobacter sp. SG918]